MEVFYRERLQAPPQPPRSAMGRDTSIPEGKKPWLSKIDSRQGKDRRDRGGLSYGRKRALTPQLDRIHPQPNYHSINSFYSEKENSASENCTSAIERLNHDEEEEYFSPANIYHS